MGVFNLRYRPTCHLNLYTGYTQKNDAVSKVNKKFLTLHGHNVHRQQRQLSKFLMRYQQFASHAYCGAIFQDGVAAGKSFLCAPFWVVQICDFSAACSAVHGLEKTHHAWCVFSKPYRCWRCTLCPCKARNKFLVNFWNRAILLCIPCILLRLFSLWCEYLTKA